MFFGGLKHSKFDVNILEKFFVFRDLKGSKVFKVWFCHFSLGNGDKLLFELLGIENRRVKDSTEGNNWDFARARKLFNAPFKEAPNKGHCFFKLNVPIVVEIIQFWA